MQTIDRDGAKRCVGRGWSALVDEAYDAMPPEAKVWDVKEKYGLLRMYVDGVDATVQATLEALEDRSGTICEICGAPGATEADGWYLHTLCKHCRAKRLYK